MEKLNRALVLGSSGFIGHHLVRYLRANGWHVVGIDITPCIFQNAQPDEFHQLDLTLQASWHYIQLANFTRIYQLAADMGGAGYVFSGDHDADIMLQSSLINLNLLQRIQTVKDFKGVLFYSSSACVYPARNQVDPLNPYCEEESAYPAEPDSEYGWEKLYSERLYQSFARNSGLEVRIARFHNIYGPECDYNSGREKAPAAICRKVLEAKETQQLEIWGDGSQTRTFLYIQDCLEALELLMNSNYSDPINIGSSELITILSLAKMAQSFEGTSAQIKFVNGPVGVAGRSSSNLIAKNMLKWEPKTAINSGLEILYQWIKSDMQQ